jgi:mediator of RNA polymerase II transcription subunit 17, fungi type
MAEGVSISLNLLLSYAHRQNHRRRTQPPPPISSQKKVVPPYNLLRAILTRLKHEETVGQLNSLFKPLCRVTASASFRPLPTFTLTSTPWIPPPQLPKAEQTILSLIDRLEAIASFTVSETTLTVAGRTALFPVPGRTSLFPVANAFYLSLSPNSPLTATCPPPPILNSISALTDYIHYFAACAIASSISTVPSNENKEGSDEMEADSGHWHQTPHPTTLRTTVPRSPTSGSKLPKTKQLSISIHPLTAPDKSGLRLRAQWEWSGKEQEGSRAGERKSSFGFPVLMEDVQGQVEENENMRKAVRGQGEGVYDWFAWEGDNGKAWDDGEGEVVRSLESVVDEAGK